VLEYITEVIGYSLRGDSMTDGWLKLVFVREILVRPKQQRHIKEKLISE
jgi:hypothetical protein